ncbi:MAG: hypothetical protein M1376_01955 [Planctomycetes bacterium]|nr:hypothetical protein [Planctomycetota bacterium]
MTTTRQSWTRRRFLRVAAASAVAGTVVRSHRVGAESPGKARERKMILSFYCDDTSPGVAGAKAFETFLDYCAKQGIRGEASAILGTGGHSMARNPSAEEKAFLQQVARAWECGIDTHMEIMTHRGLFDFAANREKKDVVHEGLWLHEPAVTVQEYQRYFGDILAEGQRGGVRFTGFTWPGCSCEACTKRYAELRASGHRAPNPAMWQALLNLAKEGKFRGRTVPCFFDSSETEGTIHRKASDGAYGVYDLMPNAGDHFGIWENNPQRVDPDYYITADGKSGILVRHLQAGAPYCIWYAHWQGLNPARGVGWPAFTTVAERIDKHLQGQVVWMRPSDITDRYHAANGWSFVGSM